MRVLAFPALLGLIVAVPFLAVGLSPAGAVLIFTVAFAAALLGYLRGHRDGGGTPLDTLTGD